MSKESKKDKVDGEPAVVAEGAGLLDMEEAIALLKTTKPTFYRWLREGKLRGIKVGRQWRLHREDIQRFLTGHGPRIDLPTDIAPLLATLESKLEEAGGILPERDGAGDLEWAVKLMLAAALTMGASDLHLQAHDEGTATMRVRVDGVLHQFAEFDRRLLPVVVEQWKVLMSCDVHEKRTPQDGRGMVKLGDAQLDVRATILPTVLGESVIARILRTDTMKFELERLGFLLYAEALYRKCLDAPSGLVVVSGPIGSGRTTTLYTGLSHVNSPERKVMTAEDPVEFLFPGVAQVQVDEKAGFGFAQAVLYLLRSDPDVMMVGEVRGAETMEMLVKGAAAGHLCLTSTYWSEDAVSTLFNMLDLCEDPTLVCETTKLVLAQRLARLLCPECAEAYEPDTDLLDEVEQLACIGGLDWQAQTQSFRKATGCAKCGNTGYKGRAVLAEAMEVTPKIAAAVKGSAPVEDVQSIAVEQGMTTMRAHGILMALEGKTSLEEVLRILPS